MIIESSIYRTNYDITDNKIEIINLMDDYHRFLYDGQGNSLKELRRLAQLLNVKFTTIKNWERGSARIYKK